MKKTFKLNLEGKHPDRLVEAIKHELRKYVKRERRKTLPPGTQYWAFDCRFGETESEARKVRLAEVIPLIDESKASGNEQFYVEIIARAAVRSARRTSDGWEGDEDEDHDDPSH